jgi:putative copper export protein
VTLDGAIRFVHLGAAATWIGGLIVLASIAAGLRRAGAGPEQMQAMARSFGRVAWPAMGIAVIVGLWQASRLDVEMTEGPMVAKLLLVAASIALAGIHQATARRTPPAVRGIVQGVILAAGLGILAAAVAL